MPLLNISGLRNQFICMDCYASGERDLVRCSVCSGYFCYDLIVYDGNGDVICFVCQGTAMDEDEWPDWAYSIVPEPKKGPLPS